MGLGFRVRVSVESSRPWFRESRARGAQGKARSELSAQKFALGFRLQGLGLGFRVWGLGSTTSPTQRKGAQRVPTKRYQNPRILGASTQ